MADTRGVFRLKAVRNDILSDEYVTPNQAFSGVPQGFDTGYNTGGSTPAAVSITDKTNYTTDTTARVPGADLNSGARKGLQGCGSVTAGYYGGGFPASDVVNKMPYSTETMATLPGTLNAARGYLSACSNELAGYWSGGAPGSNSSTDKCTFSTDTVARAPSANLSVARAFVHACSSKSAGYIGGGFLSPTYYDTVDKLSFGGDYLANVSTLANSVACEDNNASGNNQFGYFTGGFGPGSTVHSRVDKVNYSVEVTARIPAADLTTPVFKHGQTGTAFAGYASGGQTPSRISTTQKLNYSTETATAVPGAALSDVRSDMGTSSSRNSGLPTLTQPNNLKSKASFGYGLIGGGPLDGKSSFYKIDYATDVAAYAGNTTANMGSKGSGGGTQNEAYLSHSSTTNKIPYATLTATAVPSAALNASTYYCGQVSSERAMYVHGGNPVPLRTVIQKLTYATDTAETLSNNLVDGIQWPYNFSNLSVGYAAGRSNAPDTSIIQKISFVTESCNLLTSTLANTGASSSGGSGFDAGYTIQGSPTGRTNVGKFTYATETHGDIPRMFTQTAMNEGGTTGHGGAGYYMMGYTGPTGYVTSTTKTNYVTETSSRLPGANSTFANRDCFDTSSQDVNFPQPRPETLTEPTSIPGSVNNGGYHCGGYNDTSLHKSEVMKINFATDNVARVPGANLSGSRYRHTATASNEAGYNAGGRISGGSRIATVDKTTLSSETTAAVPGASLTQATYGSAAGSCSTHGYFAGGAPGGAYRSRVDKLTFSSDTTAASPNNLPDGTFLADSSVSSPGFAYQGGGVISSPLSSFTKIHFTTDTVTTVPSATLSASKYSQAAMGNTREGYFFGGASPRVSNGDRLTFSTETVQRTSNYPLPSTGETSASGNQSAGYLFGGANPAPDNISLVYKFTYSTETFDSIGGTGDSQGNAVSSGFAAREGGASHVGNNMA